MTRNPLHFQIFVLHKQHFRLNNVCFYWSLTLLGTNLWLNPEFRTRHGLVVVHFRRPAMVLCNYTDSKAIFWVVYVVCCCLHRY